VSISHQILGKPGRDNIALVKIDTGQALCRLQFDCGDNCLIEIPPSETAAVDHLFFSHFHMDHVGGFDLFFRHTYFRDDRPNMVWGPPDTSRIMHHRFRGFVWNLNQDLPGTYVVNDIHPNSIRSTSFHLKEAFEIAHHEGERFHHGLIIDTDDFTVEALEMNHITPSMAYIVREKPKTNINMPRMKALGMEPGSWLQMVKDNSIDGATRLTVGEMEYSLDELRKDFLIVSKGESIAYLTDFLLDQEAVDRLLPVLEGVNTVICECQYRHADLELSRKNYHMTTVLSAQLAKQANVGKLMLFHLSSRYREEQYLEILAEARAEFTETYFPEQWGIF